MRSALTARLHTIASSERFQAFILMVIVLNAITLGIQTYDISRDLSTFLAQVDNVFLGIFVVEIAIRLGAYGSRPQDFFRNGWNVFDFMVVAAAFGPGLRENATLLRIVRLLRVVRIVTVLPDLRVLIRALARSVPPILSLAVLTLMLMYVYAMIGWILFNEDDPANWANIGEALLSTFTMLTLENWPILLEAGLEIHPWSWIFFISYVLLASFLVINILIAIIINSVEEVHRAEREEERADRIDRLEAEDEAGVTVSQRIAGLRDALDDLEQDLELTGGAAARHSMKRASKGGRMRA